MNEKETREILDNMSEQEFNDFIFFALKEVEKENQKLKTELKKKDKIIDLMAEFINKFDLDESICKDIKCNNDVTKQDCINCIKKYFFDTKKNIF